MLEKCFNTKSSEIDETEAPSEEEFIIILPFLGTQSNIIKKKIKKVFTEFCPTTKLNC